MSVDMESPDQIERRAADWFARRDSGDWGAADQARLESWLSESPLHRVTYLRIEHAWERAQRLKVLKSDIPSHQVPPSGSWVSSPFFGSVASVFIPARSHLRSRAVSVASRRARAVGAAAGVGAALMCAAVWLFWPPGTAYSTPIGGLESVPIRDGSTVILNTDTELRVELTKKERRVTLERGEAFFEVAKDPNRPFIVQVGKRDVIAVGTQFSVRREGSDLEVIVTDGTVRLKANGPVKSPNSTGANPALANEELLPAGTVAEAGEGGILVQRETPAEAALRLSWRQGVLVFHETTLDHAIAEFNRYNVRQIVIASRTVAAFKIAGRFRATNVEGFVRLLERGYPIKVEHKDDQLILRAR